MSRLPAHFAFMNILLYSFETDVLDIVSEIKNVCNNMNNGTDSPSAPGPMFELAHGSFVLGMTDVRTVIEVRTTNETIGWRDSPSKSSWLSGGSVGVFNLCRARVEINTAPTPIGPSYHCISGVVF